MKTKTNITLMLIDNDEGGDGAAHDDGDGDDDCVDGVGGGECNSDGDGHSVNDEEK